MTATAFETELLPVLDRAYGLAYSLTHDRADAEDLIQEVLMRAHAHWPRISGMDRPDAYVRQMIVNEFISARRRAWRLLPKGRPEGVDTRTVADHACQYAERASLICELAKLPRRQRAEIALVAAAAHLESSGFPQIQSFRLPILRVGYYDTRRVIGVVTEIVGSTEAGHELRRNLKSGNF